MVVELIGGLLTNSIALISDALHMFTHSFAIGISLIAIFIARRPPCHHKTFGLFRAEVLAAFINGLFLLFFVFLMIHEAVQRIIQPKEVFGSQMFIIALVGLTVNIASITILHGSHKTNSTYRTCTSPGMGCMTWRLQINQKVRFQWVKTWGRLKRPLRSTRPVYPGG